MQIYTIIFDYKVIYNKTLKRKELNLSSYTGLKEEIKKIDVGLFKCSDNEVPEDAILIGKLTDELKSLLIMMDSADKESSDYTELGKVFRSIVRSEFSHNELFNVNYAISIAKNDQVYLKKSEKSVENNPYDKILIDLQLPAKILNRIKS